MLKAFGRLLRCREKKVFLPAPPCLLGIIGWNDLKKTNKELDEFHMLRVVMNDLWEIYSALNMHRVRGVNLLIRNWRNIRGPCLHGHWTVKWGRQCKLLLKTSYLLIEHIPRRNISISYCSFLLAVVSAGEWIKKEKQQDKNIQWVLMTCSFLIEYFCYSQKVFAIYYSYDEQAASAAINNWMWTLPSQKLNNSYIVLLKNNHRLH